MFRVSMFVALLCGIVSAEEFYFSSWDSPSDFRVTMYVSPDTVWTDTTFYRRVGGDSALVRVDSSYVREGLTEASYSKLWLNRQGLTRVFELSFIYEIASGARIGLRSVQLYDATVAQSRVLLKTHNDCERDSSLTLLAGYPYDGELPCKDYLPAVSMDGAQDLLLEAFVTYGTD